MADAHTQTEPSTSSLASRRHEFWQTLLALGFDPISACTGAYSNVQLDANVFAKGIYHTRASELVLHFLLTHLDQGRAHREFSNCWPIGGAHQARDFRAHAFRWLDEVRRASVERQDGVWPVDVPVRRSDVDEGRGLRFERALWVLAPLVARQLLSGAWRKYHYCIESEADLGAQLRRCRERYARRTRDRMRAQTVWRETHAMLLARLDSVRASRVQAYDEYRGSRRRVRSIGDAPPADASAEEVARVLLRRVGDARALWRDTAQWVDAHGEVIRAVDDVVARKANGVRLDGRRHVRLAPAPEMAAEWTRWMAAEHVRPFAGATVDLHAVVRMAAACVGALRGALDTPAGESPVLRLRAAESGVSSCGPLPEGLPGVEEAVQRREARVERLRRLRSRLMAQRAEVIKALPAPRAVACPAAALEHILSADDSPPLPLPQPRGSACRPARLADAWAAMVDPHGNQSAHVRAVYATPQSAPRVEALAGHKRRAEQVDLEAKRRSISRGLDAMALEDRGTEEFDDVPDFLVG